MREKRQDDTFKSIVGGFANYAVNNFAMPDVDAVERADRDNCFRRRLKCRCGIEYFQTFIFRVANLTILFKNLAFLNYLKQRIVYPMYTHKMFVIPLKIKKICYFCFSIQINLKKT